MKPSTSIQLPAAALERIEAFQKQERAAKEATAALMRSGVIDLSGRQTTLFDLASSIGNADAIRDAASSVFMALTSAGMTYAEFSSKKSNPNLVVPADVRHAVRHFYYVMTNSWDLQSIGVGRGDLFLITLDWYVARQLEAAGTALTKGSRLAS